MEFMSAATSLIFKSDSRWLDLIKKITQPLSHESLLHIYS